MLAAAATVLHSKPCNSACSSSGGLKAHKPSGPHATALQVKGPVTAAHPPAVRLMKIGPRVGWL